MISNLAYLLQDDWVGEAGAEITLEDKEGYHNAIGN
jgi:hypothetical protein